jgi:uncharacterized membrane protein required for colicin V production
MNWIDTIFLTVLAVNFLNGIRRGLVRGSFDILAMACAVYASLYLYPLITPYIHQWFHLSGWITFTISFLIGGAIVYGVINVVSSTIYQLIKHTSFLSPFDIFGGGVLGAVKGWVFGLLILIPMASIPFLPRDLSGPLHQSYLLKQSMPIVSQSFPHLQDWLTGFSQFNGNLNFSAPINFNVPKSNWFHLKNTI